jgi:hypothetical protein
MAGTLTISGLSTGLLTGEKVIGPLTMTGAATIGEIEDISLIAGDTTIPVPTGAVAYLVGFPSSNTSVVKLRSSLNAADAGLPLGPTGFAVLPLAPGTTSIVVNAPAVVAIEISFI